jgi:hypothetical protein
MRALPAALALALLASRASAQQFPTRGGETGILDVPDANVTGVAGGQLAAELRLDRRPGMRDDFGPLPLYAVAGLASRLDLGLTLRESGQPGDPTPARGLFGAALKLQLVRPRGFLPGAAVSTVFDKINERGVVGARLAVSAALLPVRLALFAGGEADASGLGNGGATAGVAATLSLGRRVELAAEALTGPRGDNYGGALRWLATSTSGVAIGANYFPKEDAYRFAVTLAFSSPAPRSRELPQPAGPIAAAQEEVPVGPRFLDDRPRFRLKIPQSGVQGLAAAQRHQYAPYAPSTAVAAAPAKPAEAPGAVKAAAPSLEDLAEARLRDQESAAGARARRVTAAREQLEAREKALAAETFRLAERERELAAREMELDARERRTVVRGPPTQQQRQLETLEAQLAADAQKLSAIDRSYQPALDAARGREREAAAREDAARDEAARLSAAAAAATARAEHLELRKSALAARLRELAALEARLLAIGERIDASERQLRSRTDRLDTVARRLAARAERLDHLDKRAAEPPRPPPGAPAAPPPTDAKAPAAKDKAVFVMVVKSPTAIVKERAAGPSSPSGPVIQPGAAVEKAVAAAAVVMFPTPATQLSELDRETIDNIARLAAKEGCEVLIWARAKEPGLMAEAQRRAAEIKTRVMSVGQLDQGRIVTRITTRPGAQGVDVVVSALRETARPAAAPAATPAAPKLLPGEGGKRQLREAVQAAQHLIETCVGEHLTRGRKQRAEGVLKLSVSAEGRVTRAATGGGDLAGDELETCLGAAAAQWQFPSADAEYVVDVPITVVTGGAR